MNPTVSSPAITVRAQGMSSSSASCALSKLSQTIHDVALKIFKVLSYPFVVVGSLLGRLFCLFRKKTQQPAPQVAAAVITAPPINPQSVALVPSGRQPSTGQLLREATLSSTFNRRLLIQDPYFLAGLDLPSEQERFRPAHLALVPYRPQLIIEDEHIEADPLLSASTHSSVASSLDDREFMAFNMAAIADRPFRYTWQPDFQGGWERYRLYPDLGEMVLDEPPAPPAAQVTRQPAALERHNAPALPQVNPLANAAIFPLMEEAAVIQQHIAAPIIHHQLPPQVPLAEIPANALQQPERPQAAQQLGFLRRFEIIDINALQRQTHLAYVRVNATLSRAMTAVRGAFTGIQGLFTLQNAYRLLQAGSARGMLEMVFERAQDPYVQQILDTLTHLSEIPEDVRQVKSSIELINFLSLLKIHHIAMIPQVSRAITNVSTAPMRFVYDNYVEPHFLNLTLDQVAPLFRLLARLPIGDDQQLILEEAYTGFNWIGTQARLIQDAPPQTAEAFARDKKLFDGINPLRKTTPQYQVLRELGLVSLPAPESKLSHLSNIALAASKLLTIDQPNITKKEVIKKASLLEAHDTIAYTLSQKALRPAFAALATMIMSMLCAAAFASDTSIPGKIAKYGPINYTVKSAVSLGYQALSGVSSALCHVSTLPFRAQDDELSLCHSMGSSLETGYTHITNTLASASMLMTIAIILLGMNAAYSAVKPARTAAVIRTLRAAMQEQDEAQAAPAQGR